VQEGIPMSLKSEAATILAAASLILPIGTEA
jgi:hypothetical protein